MIMSFSPSADLTAMQLALASIDSKTRGRFAYRSTATITRAANTTQYTGNAGTNAYDVYGGVFELPVIGATDGFIRLDNIRVVFNITAVPSGMRDFYLYLYSATPPSAIADNGAFSIPSGDRATILTPEGLPLGDCSLARGGGSVVLQTSFLPPYLIKMPSTSTSLFGYLVTGSTFTPTANSETATFSALAMGV
jgi:hypothetical protein